MSRAVSRAEDKELPPGDEAALALVAGSVAIAPLGLIYVLLFVSAKHVPLGVRLLHLTYEVIHTLGAGCLVAVLLFGLFKVCGRRESWFWLWGGFLVSFALWPLVDATVHRRTIVLASNVGLGAPGVGVTVLRIAQHLAVGFSLMMMPYFGITAARVEEKVLRRWAPGVVLLLGMSVGILNHYLLADEYEDAHFVMLWAAWGLSGGAIFALLRRRLERRRKTIGLFALGAALLFFVPTPMDVRLQLFRKPGAGASFILAQTVWSLPEVPPVEASLPARRRNKEKFGHAAGCVVLLTIDALRADVLSAAYAPRFPELSYLKDHGLSFSEAITPGSQTSVSLTSLFSGRYFSELEWDYHGTDKRRRLYAVGDPTPRLAELLQKSGVRSFSALSPGFLGGAYGVARGFDDERVLTEKRHARAEETAGLLLEELSKFPGERRFLFTHVMDAHEPYDRGALHEGSPKERYLSEVEMVDAWVGRIRRALQRHRPRDGYLIVSTDHGEAFGEHDTTFHSKSLYQELIHVPLLVWGPGLAPVESDDEASLIDVGPTVLELFGQETPPWHKGDSLLGRPANFERTYPLAAEGRLRRAYFDEVNGLKVIESLRIKTTEVYDLKIDPDELHNLFGKDPRAEMAIARSRAFFAQIEKPEFPYKR